MKRTAAPNPSTPTGGPLPRSGVGMGLGGPLDPALATQQAVAASKQERAWSGWQRPLGGQR